MRDSTFDVVVVGGGHAGSEAASSCARLGAKTCLVTLSLDHLGQMPCNPAIGGIAKGHLVREIDALGGIMGRLADQTAIQYRRLNTRKGPAVRATRAQIDRFAYVKAMTHYLSTLEGLTLCQGEVKRLAVSDCGLEGVLLGDGQRIRASRVIVTAGTYLNGLLHVGPEIREGGIWDLPPSKGLSASLAAQGITMGRLKTGTPPRLDSNSIDYSQCEEQPGDPAARQFSPFGPPPPLEQIPCHLTWTTGDLNEIIEEGIHQSPLFNGQISGVGPRYCPSIEDKVKTFPQRRRHHLFLEPEGLTTNWVYPNGISTSLPKELQRRVVHSIPGLQKARIERWGYAVEYDFADPTQLLPTCESRLLPGLYLAGQINGTSGYEEAAGQGLIAGINAARACRGEQPFTVPRHKGYIGVMLHDLTTKGVDEPYRLFTSRAEYRLLLREDNAQARLTPMGRDLGLVDDETWNRFQQQHSLFEKALKRLKRTRLDLTRGRDLALLVGTTPPKQSGPLEEFLKRPEITWEVLTEQGIVEPLPPGIGERIESTVKYRGYIQHQATEVQRLERLARIPLPPDFDLTTVAGMRAEWIQKIQSYRPKTLGEVATISGIPPSAIVTLAAHLNSKG